MTSLLSVVFLMTFAGPEAFSAVSFAPLAASALVAAVWQSVVLVGVVAVALRLVPRLSPAVRSMVWTAVLVLSVALPVVSLVAPHPLANAAVASGSHAALELAAGWSVAIAALWAGLSLVRLVQLARSAAHLARISRNAVPVATSELSAETVALLAEGRGPELCVSADVDRPSVAGFFRPRILLPEGLLERVTPLELEQILRHEREHLNRYDDWVNLAQKLALAVFPLNPALLVIERRLAAERELACDDTVLRETGAPKAYALCLASLAEMSLARRATVLALAAWQRRSELAARVDRILFSPQGAMARRPAAAAGALVTLLAAGSAATLAHAPALVSFVPASGKTEVANAAVRHSLPAQGFSAVPVVAKLSGGARRPHATELMVSVREAAPTPSPAVTRAISPVHVTRAIETVAHTGTVKREPAARELIASMDGPATPDAEDARGETVIRQGVATAPDGSVTAWYVEAHFAAPSTAATANIGAQPKPVRAQHPVYRPAYAIPTPNGWLVLEL